jgi:hypothetical protein
MNDLLRRATIAVGFLGMKRTALADYKLIEMFLKCRKKPIKNVKLSRKKPWKPIGLLDVKDPTLSRQSAHS